MLRIYVKNVMIKSMERKYNIVSNLVKIHYSGKDYIGQIVSIESEWDCLRMMGNHEIERTLLYYKVSMYEKDTGCLIDNIFIRSIEEIKQYEGGANG